MTVTDGNGRPAVAGEILLPEHAELISASGITSEVAEARGYSTAHRSEQLAAAGFAPSQRLVPALLIPVHSIDGEVRLHQSRPNNPRSDDKGKPIKYETPFGGVPVLDAPPPVRARILDPARPLWITEGIRKADSAASAGLPCLGLLGTWLWCRGKDDAGRHKPLPDWGQIPLDGRRTYVVFDSDVTHKPEVRLALEALFAFLTERGAQPRIVYLPSAPDGEKVGLDDYLAAGHAERDLLELAELELRPAAGGGGANRSLAKRLVDHALSSGAELFHTPAGEPYATVPVGGHRETMPLESRGFQRWLGRLLHDQGAVAGGSSIKDATAWLEGKALYDGAEHPVSIRVAGADGAVYLDLGDPSWRAIEVRPAGWKVIDQAPVKFRRTPAMLPLPEPVRGGSADELRLFVNAPEEHWPLLLGWAVVSLMPCDGYPLLVFHGEQGTAKSTAAELTRALVDPARPGLRSEPDTINNLMIAAANNWVLAYDNLSGLNRQLSDALCRLSTGGGHAVRALYTNSEETVIDATRPMILTGIEAQPRRSDLLDRALLIELPRIPPEDRQPKSVLTAEFEPRRASILGSLLDGVASALANRGEVRLASTPRMADFAVLATAAEPGLGLTPGAVLAAYASNREDATSTALEASPLWPMLADLADGQARTASELLTELNDRASEAVQKRHGWPSAPHVLSGYLKRLAPNLRDAGIDVERGSSGRHDRRRNTVTLRRKGHDPSDPSDPSAPAPQTREIAGAAEATQLDAGALGRDAGGARGRSGAQDPGAKKPVDPGMGSLGSLGSLDSGLGNQEK